MPYFHSLFSDNRVRSAELALLLVIALLLAGCSREQINEAAPATPAIVSRSEPTGDALTPTPTPTVSPTATSTPRPTPTPTSTPTITSPPTPGPTVAPDIAAAPIRVREGDFLSTVAMRYHIGLNELVAYNHIENPDAVAAGQRLMIPYHANQITPAQILLPDSELVYGPAYQKFKIEAFVQAQGGWLAQYSQPWFDGQTITGAQLVDYVAMRYSVGPRVLLALLEARSGWVTNSNRPQGYDLDYPLGHLATGGGLEVQLEWAADALNSGFYGWLERGETGIRFRDYRIARGAPGLNPGTIAIQRTLAQDTTFEELPREIDAFMTAYRRLFGNPSQYDQGRIIPWGLQQPAMKFPWEPGSWWFLTGGPHGAWGQGSSWAALDFVPEDAPIGGCTPATSWARAVAPGIVVYNNRGELLVDMDGDGDVRTGWVIQYLHISDRPAKGAKLQTGDIIGHPSCEGGQAASSHLHIARRYNGVWMAAGGSIPFQLDGWRAFAVGTAYEGGMIGPEGKKLIACDCREKNINGIWLK